MSSDFKTSSSYGAEEVKVRRTDLFPFFFSFFFLRRVKTQEMEQCGARTGEKILIK